MASNINVQAAGVTLQIIDNAGSIQRLNSPISNLLAQATVAFYDSYFQVTATTYGTAQALSLPATTVYFVWIRNLHATNTLSVIGTVTGGVAWPVGSVPILAGGGVFAYLMNYSAAPANGIIALSVFASASPTPAEILIAS